MCEEYTTLLAGIETNLPKLQSLIISTDEDIEYKDLDYKTFIVKSNSHLRRFGVWRESFFTSVIDFNHNHINELRKQFAIHSMND